MASWSRINAPDVPELPVFAHACDATLAGARVELDCIAYRPA